MIERKKNFVLSLNFFKTLSIIININKNPKHFLKNLKNQIHDLWTTLAKVSKRN